MDQNINIASYTKISDTDKKIKTVHKNKTLKYKLYIRNSQVLDIAQKNAERLILHSSLKFKLQNNFHSQTLRAPKNFGFV